MIKTRYGDIEITGSTIEVLADYAFITHEVISAFKQKNERRYSKGVG